LNLLHPKHVRFRCQRCALCCGDTENRVRQILLLNTEAEHISKKTFRGLDQFAEKVEGSEPYVYMIKKTEDGRCLFLRDRLCSIYEIRPIICRFYPFHLKNLRGLHVFNYTDECPGIGKGPYLERIFFGRMFKNFIKLMREDVETRRCNSACSKTSGLFVNL